MLAYYTYYFGPDNNYNNVIPKIPSTVNDCYYFTNNRNTFSKLELGVYFKKNNKNFFINEDYNFDDLFKALINLDIEAFPKNIEEI